PPLAGEGRVGAPLASGCSRTSGHVPFFGEALEHSERQLVDTARTDAPANRVPRFPLDRMRFECAAHLLVEPTTDLADTKTQDALLMQLVDVATLGPDPDDGIAPRLLDGSRRSRLTQPAVTVHRVVSLLLKHLLETAAQHLDIAAGEGLDHEREGIVQHAIGGDEGRPVRPGSIKVGNIRVGAWFVWNVRCTKLAQRPVQDAGVADVVASHGSR